MFQNPCVGDLGYEGTAAAILMAGIFISFLVEYFGERIMKARIAKKFANSSPEGISLEKHNASLELVNITVMEAGIIFHSLSKWACAYFSLATRRCLFQTIHTHTVNL